MKHGNRELYIQQIKEQRYQAATMLRDGNFREARNLTQSAISCRRLLSPDISTSTDQELLQIDYPYWLLRPLPYIDRVFREVGIHLREYAGVGIEFVQQSLRRV